jgi:CheY-like chemotaxis protein
MATKLLLADDSVTIQKVVNLTFAAENVVIESVTDGNLAIERARSVRPDIVLADVFMPGLNGYEVCAAIKSDPELAATPVVLLVGTFEPFDELEASRVKCDAYLTKPFDTSELIEVVYTLVEKGSAGQQGELAASGVNAASRSRKSSVAESDAGTLVTNRTRASFLGADRILDLFEVGTSPSAPETSQNIESTAAPNSKEATRHVIPFPGIRGQGQTMAPLSEDTINLIVEKVVHRMSQDVVREIAWEVVPELSEILIRQYLDELKIPGKK